MRTQVLETVIAIAIAIGSYDQIKTYMHIRTIYSLLKGPVNIMQQSSKRLATATSMSYCIKEIVIKSTLHLSQIVIRQCNVPFNHDIS